MLSSTNTHTLSLNRSLIVSLLSLARFLTLANPPPTSLLKYNENFLCCRHTSLPSYQTEVALREMMLSVERPGEFRHVHCSLRCHAVGKLSEVDSTVLQHHSDPLLVWKGMGVRAVMKLKWDERDGDLKFE